MQKVAHATSLRPVLLVLGLLTGCDHATLKSEAEPRAATFAEPPPGTAELRVAAASDLSGAFPELGSAFEQATRAHPEFSFAASGLLTKQLEQGAPFDVFASANVQFVDQLIEKGICDADSKELYARGHLVAWRKQGGVPLDSLEDLKDARVRRIAIANPETAPYGKAAKQALEKAGLWKELEPRVVYAENIRQTMQFAESGNAEVAFVALSLALSAKGGAFFEIDQALHAPIDQAIVVCKNGKNREAGVKFVRFVHGETGRKILRSYGLVLPGETIEPYGLTE